jgi:hypothetical protein
MLKQQALRERLLATTPQHTDATATIQSEVAVIIAQHECSLEELKLVIEDQKLIIAEKDREIQDGLKAVEEREEAIKILQIQVPHSFYTCTHTRI